MSTAGKDFIAIRAVDDEVDYVIYACRSERWNELWNQFNEVDYVIYQDRSEWWGQR